MFQYNSKTIFSRTAVSLKIIFSIFIMLSALLVSNLNVQLTILLSLAALLLLSHFRDYKKLFVILIPFLVFTNLSLYIILSSQPNYLYSLTLVSLRFTNIFLTFTFFLHTTNLFSLVALLRKLRVPEPITLALYVTLRFFPEIEREFTHITQIQKLKGITLRNPLRFIRAYTLPLFYTVFDRADELSIAYYLREKRNS